MVSGLPEEHPRKGEQGGWLVAVMLGRGRSLGRRAATLCLRARGTRASADAVVLEPRLSLIHISEPTRPC